MPKLSIITINYNNKNGLKKTIESVINQTWKDFEYIIVDGGSTDGSLDIIKQYENQINFWVSEPDKGIYNALNKGINYAKGEYLLFLNGDDCLIHNEILCKINNHIKGKDLIYFDVETVDDNKKNTIYYPHQLSFYFFYITTICHQAVFFKKDIFIKYGLFDENLKIVSDWKFIMLSIIKYNVSYKHINDVFCVFDGRGISSAKDKNNKHAMLHIQERQKVLSEEFPLFVSDYSEFQLLKFYFEKYKLGYIKKIAISLRQKFSF
ncbi:glycosyltransferase family 2 protein [Flavobacterium commune]|uniref:Glycosyltransferase 2-like domain-containing protein n=1 Tax=Flavobacterium commune TaxID=1306519 RepID=A0A1D9P7J3_9FLAO|nr:glycosyltransferase family 2 protein [Flavobacterium commune]AOZ98548.1 hypothetical protein BIW12_03365 [Flavobacterium commune]